MSRGRKAKTISNGSTSEENFNKSQGFYFQYIIIQLGRKNRILSEDSADNLLKTIRQEKERLVTDKKLKIEKSLPKIKTEEIPFEIPDNWIWCRLGECSINRDGERVPIPSTEREKRNKIYDYYGASGVIDKIDNFTHDGRFLLIGEDGANLVSRSTPVAFIADGKFWVNNHAHVIETVNRITTDYLCNYLNGISLKPYITGGFQPKLSQGKLNLIVVPLPPLSEQNKILDFIQDFGKNALKENNEYFDSEIENDVISLHQAQLYNNQITTELSHQLELVRQLRQAFLREAMQGKLVLQDTTDEPAAVLLEKIKAEKEKLIAEKKIKKDKPLPEIKPEEIPFEIPNNWTWCRLGNITDLITSGSRDWAKYYSSKGAIFVRMGNLSKDSFNLRLNKIQYVNPPKNTEGNRTRLEQNDILVSITGEVGNLGLIPENFGEAYINQHTALARLNKNIFQKYIAFSFLSNFLQEQFNAPQRGLKNSFRLSDIDFLIVSLPPLAEQKRIVEKLEKLMKFCDELEANIRESKSNAESLLQVALKEALEPK